MVESSGATVAGWSWFKGSFLQWRCLHRGRIFFQSPNDAQTQALKQLSSSAVLETIQFVDFVDVLISFYLVLNLCWANVQNSWIGLRHTLTPSRPMGPAFNTLMCAASSHRKWILWDDAVTVRDCKQPSWNTAGCVKDLESLKINHFTVFWGWTWLEKNVDEKEMFWWVATSTDPFSSSRVKF